MVSESRKQELLEAIKYNPTLKPNKFFVFIRSIPWLYSFYLKIRVFISINVYTKKGKNLFKSKKDLFLLNEKEQEYVKNLRENGIIAIEGYFDDSLLDNIQQKANLMFHDLDIYKQSYNITHKRLASLDDMSYEELEVSEVGINAKEPLINVPDFIKIAFDERLLKILSNYLGYIPTHASAIMRGFPKNPPVESSFFHKDSHIMEILNVFVYLNDVDENGGPFCYVPKSHNNSIQSCRPRESADLGKMDSYGRTSDEDMNEYYPKETWMPMKGKKGTIIIADTIGFHKGPMWRTDVPVEKQYHRDMLQIHCRSKVTFKNSCNKNISKNDVSSFSELQKLFLSEYNIV